LPESARTAVAVAPAQRLMDRWITMQASLSPIGTSLSSTSSKIWINCGTRLRRQVHPRIGLRRLLKKRESEPYADQTGKNGWPRGDDNPFAASRYALAAYVRKDPKTASAAAMRLLD